MYLSHEAHPGRKPNPVCPGQRLQLNSHPSRKKTTFSIGSSEPTCAPPTPKTISNLSPHASRETNSTFSGQMSRLKSRGNTSQSSIACFLTSVNYHAFCIRTLQVLEGRIHHGNSMLLFKRSQSFYPLTKSTDILFSNEKHVQLHLKTDSTFWAMTKLDHFVYLLV